MKIDPAKLKDLYRQMGEFADYLDLAVKEYSDDQPRDDSGRWTSGGGGGGGSGDSGHFDSAARMGGTQADWSKWDEHDAVLSNMSDQERDDFVEYTAGQYKDINSMLRGETAPSSDYDNRLMDRANRLESVLDKTETPEDWIVYRGGKIPPDAMQTGTVFTDNGFISTSRSEGMAREFLPKSGNAAIFEILVPRGTHAAYIRQYSHNPSEYEMIIQRGTSFRVVSSEKRGKEYYVRVMAENG